MKTPEPALLDALVEEAMARVASFPTAKVLAAARAAKTLLYGPDAQTSAEHRRPFKDVYKTADDLRRDLEARAPAAKGGVVALYAALDPDGAARFVASVLPHKLEAFAFGTWQADLWYALWIVLPELAPRIPLAMLVELSMANRIPESYARPGMYGAIPLEEIARAARNERVFDADLDALFEEHEGLRDPKTVLALLEQSALGTPASLLYALLGRLGSFAYDPAIPYLTKLATSDAPKRLPAVALGALAQMATPAATSALVAMLPQILDNQELPAHNAVIAAIALAPTRSTETLKAYFADAALATPSGRARATRILAVRSSSEERPGFDADPRWLERAVHLLQGPLYAAAREFLATYDNKLVSAALATAGYKASKPPKPLLHALPKNPRWLARYEKGEHAAVWAEIAALEDSAQDPAIVDEATAVARAMMTRVRTNLEAIVALLKQRKYAFGAKSVKKALVAPDPKRATSMTALEKLAGASLPLSLRAFWDVVGSVDLTELDAAGNTAEGLGECDPLMIEAPKLPLSLLKDRAADEKRYPAELRRPTRDVMLGLDPATKFDADDANDAPYAIEIVGTRADGVIRQGDRALPFVEYLRQAIAAGGFCALPPEGERHDETMAALAALRKDRLTF